MACSCISDSTGSCIVINIVSRRSNRDLVSRDTINSLIYDPSSLRKLVKECDIPIMPACCLYKQILFSSCSCETSASALRRLNNYLISSITEECLTVLALMFVTVYFVPHPVKMATTYHKSNYIHIDLLHLLTLFCMLLKYVMIGCGIT